MSGLGMGLMMVVVVVVVVAVAVTVLLERWTRKMVMLAKEQGIRRAGEAGSIGTGR